MEQRAGTIEAFWHMLHQSRRLRDTVDKKMLPYCAGQGLTPLSLRLLITLYFEGPMTISALAEGTCTAGANISALCKRLESEGHVYRKRAADDERRVLVSLSPPGEALAAGFLRQCEGSGDLSALCSASGEINTILASMQSLLDVLEDKGDTA